MPPNTPPLRIFGINLNSLPRIVILAIGVIGIFVSFLLQGMAQETLFAEFKFKYTIFLTFTQFVAYSLLSVSFFYRVATKEAKFNAPFIIYFILGSSICGSMYFSNTACKHLSYPTQVLFKSSKMIPLIIFGFVFMKKRFPINQVISAVLITFGLIGMFLADIKVKNHYDTFGLISISTSLLLDSVSSNLQDKAFSEYKCEQTELISTIYSIGALILLIVSIVTGQFQLAIEACRDNTVIWRYIIYFSLSGAAGVQFVYLLIKAYGSLITVMVTSLRKAGTVILSFICFKNKTFTLQHGLSITLIFIGIYLNTIKSKTSKSRKKHN